MEQKIVETVEAIHRLLRESGYMLSVAESCTGGLISHALTAVPGASTCYAGGVIAYSEEVKTTVLGLSAEQLARDGVVSSATALAMAEMVRLRTGSEASVATTGNLGPGVLEGKESGLVYIAAGTVHRTDVRRLLMHGSRSENKEEAALTALRLLAEVLEAEKDH
jgi:PncC family amidohydrolase